jgi:parvulin-like peptidyl-prolyl isomerase
MAAACLRRAAIRAAALGLALLSGTAWPAQASPEPGARPPSAVPAAPAAAPVFATVGGTTISLPDYQRALSVATRKKYYHAKPPEGEYAAFQREVGDEVVNRTLLLAEARRRGIQPDRDKIKATVAGYDSQYQGSANWAANREKMLAAVVPQLENESLLDRLERLVRQGPEPDEAAARAYYEQHRELFIEPEQVKLRVILLKVDPSSRQVVWDSAMTEGRQLHRKLLAGADFGELARLHSGDRSAANGGEMDYTHRGMLPQAMHGVIDALKPGGLSEPVQLLEGVAIVRLDGRREAQPRSFEQVRPRAAELWQRAEADARWRKLIAELRKSTTIRVDESHYAPLRGPVEKPRAS